MTRQRALRCESVGCPAAPTGVCAPCWADEFEMLSGAARRCHVALPSTDLYRQGEPSSNYFVVIEGWVGTRVLLDDGSWHMLDVALPGALLGAQPMSGRPMTHSAACLGKVVVWPIPRRRLDALAGSVPRVALRLAHVTACREARLQDHFVNIAGREARERVAHFLMELFQRIRHRPPASGDHVLIPLTLSHIGEALNLTEVHVSRTLRTLRIQGVVRFFRQKLDVLDAQACTRAAGSMGETETFGDELAADLPSRE